MGVFHSQKELVQRMSTAKKRKSEAEATSVSRAGNLMTTLQRH